MAIDTTVANSPNCILPPITIPPGKRVLAKDLSALEATVPPFNVRVFPVPLPKLIVALDITVPALSVKPPVKVFPAVPNTPAPFLINPVPAAVEIDCELKSNKPPLPISKVRTVPLVANVFEADAKLTVTPFATVTFPTFTVAPMPANV